MATDPDVRDYVFANWGWNTPGTGGGYASTQIDYIVTHRCNACRHTWTRSVTETR